MEKLRCKLNGVCNLNIERIFAISCVALGIFMASRIQTFFCLLLSVVATATAARATTTTTATAAIEAKAFKDITLTPARIPENEARGDLREDAKEVAQVLGVEDAVERLRREKGNFSNSKELQSVRLMCLWKIFIAAEEVRKVVTECQFDLAQAHIALDQLTGKKQMVSNMITTANFMQGGTLGIVKQSISFKNSGKTRARVFRRRAQEIAITSFSTGTGLAMLNQMIGPVWSRRIDCRPTMLSHIFDENYQPADHQISYLWKFYSKPCPGYTNNLTRRQVLVKHWQDFGGVNVSNKNLVDKVSADVEDIERENIRILSTRISLLNDLVSHIEEFDASLYELHKAITN